MPVTRKIWLRRRALTQKDATQPILHAFPIPEDRIDSQPRVELATIEDLPKEILFRIIDTHLALLIRPADDSRISTTTLRSLLNLALINRHLAGVVRSYTGMWATMLRIARSWRSFNAIRLLIGNSRLQVSTRTDLDLDRVLLMIRDIEVLELQPSSNGQEWIDALNRLPSKKLKSLIELRINPQFGLGSPFHPLSLNAPHLERLYTNVPVSLDVLSVDITYLVLGPTFSRVKRGEDLTTVFVNILKRLSRLRELIIYHPRATFGHTHGYGLEGILNLKTALSVTSGSTFLRRFCLRKGSNGYGSAIIHAANADAAVIDWPNVTTLQICGLILPINAPRVQNCAMTDAAVDPRRTLISGMVHIDTLAINSVVLDNAAPNAAPLVLPRLASISYESSMTAETGSFFANISLPSCLRRVHLVVDLTQSCTTNFVAEGNCVHRTVRNLLSLNNDDEDLGFAETHDALSTHPYFQDELELVAKFRLPDGYDETLRVQFSVRKLHTITPDEHVVHDDGLHVDVTSPNDIMCRTHSDDLPGYTCLGTLRLLAYEGIRRICVGTLPSNAWRSDSEALGYDYVATSWGPPDFGVTGEGGGWPIANEGEGFSTANLNPKRGWKSVPPRFDLLDPFYVTGEGGIPFLQEQFKIMHNVREITLVICRHQEVVGNGIFKALGTECIGDAGNETVLLPHLEVVTLLDQYTAQECSQEETIEKGEVAPSFVRGLWYKELESMAVRRARLANIGLCQAMRIVLKGDFDGRSAADAHMARKHLDRIRKSVPVEYQYVPACA